MGRKIEYKNGDMIGLNKFIKEVSPSIDNSGRLTRRALLLCRCGNLFEASIAQIRSRPMASCGCYRLERFREVVGDGTLRKTKYYKAWANIKNRCYNKNSHDYKYYGGRGITMSDEFSSDSVLFCEYVMSLPNSTKEGYTIDRINNDRGYERGNIRWASKQTQAINRRKQYNNKSGYVGVVANIGAHCSGKFISRITHGGVRIHIGMFDTAEEAAIARDEYIKKNGLPHKLSPLSKKNKG